MHGHMESMTNMMEISVVDVCMAKRNSKMVNDL